MRALDARHGVEPRAARRRRRERRGLWYGAVRVPPRAVFNGRRAAVVAGLLHEALDETGEVLGRVDDNLVGAGGRGDARVGVGGGRRGLQQAPRGLLGAEAREVVAEGDRADVDVLDLALGGGAQWCFEARKQGRAARAQVRARLGDGQVDHERERAPADAVRGAALRRVVVHHLVGDVDVGHAQRERKHCRGQRRKLCVGV